MFGAYVLFPYNNEEEYQKHKFYESIRKVNVGGLPFLPSSTTLLSNFIDELVGDSPDSAFERYSRFEKSVSESLASVWDNPLIEELNIVILCSGVSSLVSIPRERTIDGSKEQ